MANLDSPRGLKPVYMKSGGDLPASIKLVANGEIFRGDPVKLEADGDVAASTANTDRLLGVATTYASGAGQEVMVVKHPDLVYEAQLDDASTFTDTEYGLMCGLAYSAGNASTKLSGIEIDASSAANSDQQLRIEKGPSGNVVKQTPDNAAGANAVVYVSIFDGFENTVSKAAATDTSPGV